MTNILIIGAGKVGTSLFRAFQSLDEIEAFLHDIRPFGEIESNHISPSQFYPKLDQSVIQSVSIIFIAVEDDNITKVSNKLNNFMLDGKMVVHTSGASDSSVLENLNKRGALTGSLHPMQTFTRPFLMPSIWKNTVCTYEGDHAAMQSLESIFKKLDAKILPVSKTQKILFHICGVIVSNYVVGLIAWAEKLLAGQNFEEKDIRKMLYPLIHTTVENYQANPVENILSGPLQRGDSETIKKHLDYLNEKAKTADLELYNNLAHHIISNAKLKIKNRNQLSEIIENYER